MAGKKKIYINNDNDGVSEDNKNKNKKRDNIFSIIPILLSILYIYGSWQDNLKIYRIVCMTVVINILKLFNFDIYK